MAEPEYTPIVRPYTAEERKVVRPGDEDETEWDKLSRRRTTRAIDEARYREAMEIHPDMTSHFQRLIDLGYEAVKAWENGFIDSALPMDIPSPYVDAASGHQDMDMLAAGRAD